MGLNAMQLAIVALAVAMAPTLALGQEAPAPPGAAEAVAPDAPAPVDALASDAAEPATSEPAAVEPAAAEAFAFDEEFYGEDLPVAEGALSDPFEGVNRAIYGFNEVVDRAALEPIARGYRAVTPTLVRRGVRNFLSNLGSPVVFANDVLQGNIDRAGTTLGRFAVNSTFGVLGLMDAAEDFGLDKHSEDFGQTLGVWGISSGPYLVLPLLGPSTVRDAIGQVGDAALNPINYLDGHDMDEIRIGLAVTGVVSGREAALETVENIRTSSADPYVTIRSLYGQARASAVRNGEGPSGDAPTAADAPLPEAP